MIFVLARNISYLVWTYSNSLGYYGHEVPETYVQLLYLFIIPYYAV
jgi:hypothetical protein